MKNAVARATEGDIVTRLRAIVADPKPIFTAQLLDNAADEIERLRLILTHICDVWGSDLLSIIEEMKQFKKDIK